ncbi:glycosyltransferase family 2 protein [Metabacillus halosaccharovorans]|uniref:glycosyltransferase family 2 protein n=1 Tax=Metabacillus halosaccharovorans TaxID=930124 RepID=UPI001473840C|nr:glycosyltransferase family 2 protein [Metabacillus halosaccharovorans]
MKISLALIVKNEENHIKKCLDSVENFVDEIVIVDTGSTDNTVSIIKQYQGVNLFYFEWCDDFSAARNFAISKTSGNYILMLDADEHIIEGTIDDFSIIMKKNSIGRILISSEFIKDGQIFQSNQFVSRFFPRDIKYVGSVHEQLDSNIPRFNMNIIAKHSGYIDSTEKCKRNIPLLQKELNKNANDSYFLFQLGKELRINNEFEKALKLLVKSYNLTDKKSAYYSRLVIEIINCGKEYVKEEVVGIIRDNEQLLFNVTDFHFSKGLFYLNYCLTDISNSMRYIDEIEKSFLSCLKLNVKPHIQYLQGTSTYLPAYNLGVYYEVFGDMERAIEYYYLSSNYGYSQAKARVGQLTKNNFVKKNIN